MGIASVVPFLLLATFAGALNGQTRPAAIFDEFRERIRGKTQIPVLLPSRLAPAMDEKKIRLVDGDASARGYGIGLYFSEDNTSNAMFAGAISGSAEILSEFYNMRRVRLKAGPGLFRPVSCGGSCAPANLWFVREGIQYHLQAKLRSTMSVSEQRRAMVEFANSLVLVRD